MQHASRSELPLKCRVFRVVRIFGLFLGIEMVEVTKELVEAVHRREKLILVSQVIFSELASGVAERLQEFRNGRVFRADTESAPGIPTLVRPVRIGFWPVINAARPAVQLC